MNVVLITAGLGIGSASKLLASIKAQELAQSFICVNGNINIKSAFNSGVQSDMLAQLAIRSLQQTISEYDLQRWAKTWNKHYLSMMGKQMAFDMRPSADSTSTFYRYARDFHEVIQSHIEHEFEKLGVDVVEYYQLLTKKEQLDQQIDELLAAAPVKREEQDHRLFCEAFFGSTEYSEKHSDLIRELRHNLPNAVLCI